MTRAHNQHNTLVKTVAAVVLGAGLSLSPSHSLAAQEQAQQRSQSTAELTSCFIKNVAEQQRCTTVTVPLDWGNPDGQTIDVHVAIMPATSGKSQADPLVLLAGGPGQASGELANFVRASLVPIHADRDIVLIDQRGTGKSHPLRCDMKDAYTLLGARAAIQACQAEIGIDTRFFTLENTIKDYIAVFDALGYQKVNLWGGSYGTRTGALMARRHPDRVRSMILDGVVPPDVRLFETAPRSAERAKQKLIQDCQSRSDCAATFPDIAGDIERYIDAARSGNLVYENRYAVPGVPKTYNLSDIMAVESIRSVMYGASGSVVLPYVANQAAAGNLDPAMASLLGGTSVSDSIYLGLMLSILCGDEVDRITPDEARAAGQGSFARDTYYRNFKNMCDVWSYSSAKGDLPKDGFDPLTVDIPTLILSGDIDPVTPPELGQHLADSLPNARHIIVPGTGHNTGYVSCMPYLMSDFLNTLDLQSLQADCIDHVRRLPIVLGPNGQLSR